MRRDKEMEVVVCECVVALLKCENCIETSLFFAQV